jgi:hypothetical protein
MNNIKKLAVLVFAVAGFSGCATTQVAELATAQGAQAPADETKVSRPLSGYGYMGGYRYRRFAAVAKAT